MVLYKRKLIPIPMSPKVKFHLKWIIPVVIVIILLVLLVLSQSPKVTSATVSPEVVVKGQATEINVTVTVKPGLFILPRLKAVLAEQGYKGNPKSQDDWVKFFSVFQLNPKILGYLTNTGKDQEGNVVYKGTFTVNYSIAQTVQIQPTNMFGTNLLPNVIPQMARLAITTRPATLPPDPGEAGKQTLEGIDSDKDGVRDDLQREIMFLAPESEKLRMGLKQLAIPYQSLANQISLSRSDVDVLLDKFFSGGACFSVLLAGDPSNYLTYSIPKSFRADANMKQLFEVIKNTNARKLAETDNENKHGFGSTGIDSIKRCSFDPSKLPD